MIPRNKYNTACIKKMIINVCNHFQVFSKPPQSQVGTDLSIYIDNLNNFIYT